MITCEETTDVPLCTSSINDKIKKKTKLVVFKRLLSLVARVAGKTGTRRNLLFLK